MSSSPDRLRVLVAPDKFKGSAPAAVVARALADGIRSTAPAAHVDELAVADGGDGTVAAFLARGHRPVRVTTHDALGAPVEGTVCTDGRLVVVEMASLCGQSTLAGGHEPLRATSRGLGSTLRDLLGRGHHDVVVGLGGSASTDGGLGMLVELGARVTDRRGRPVTPDGAGLLRAAALDLADVVVPSRLRAACDVDAVLHGPRGAAASFGPQKGADPRQVAELDRALERWGHLLADACGREVAAVPGAGAAGGVGAALLATGATVVGGADTVLDVLGLDGALAGADLVVTGEGAWDAQSEHGKAPGAVVGRAAAAGVPAVVVAGRLLGPLPPSVAAGYDLTAVAGSVESATRDVTAWLHAVGESIGDLLADLRRLDPRWDDASAGPHRRGRDRHSPVQEEET